jgi:hypothetical protein
MLLAADGEASAFGVAVATGYSVLRMEAAWVVIATPSLTGSRREAIPHRRHDDR